MSRPKPAATRPSRRCSTLGRAVVFPVVVWSDNAGQEYPRLKRALRMKKLTGGLFGLAWLILGLVGFSHAGPSGRVQDCRIATQTVPLDGGVLHYNRVGTGRPILLLHGLFAQKEQWNDFLCLLSAAGHAAIAPDLPGYGQSLAFPLAAYSLDRQVALLHQFVDRLGLARFELAGNSLGGTIAALYARRHPQHVHTLAFVGAPLGITEWGPRVKAAFHQGINPFIPTDLAQFDLEMRLLFVNPPAIPESVKTARVKAYVERHRHYQQVWNIVNLDDTVLYSTRRSAIPTLILWGKQDNIFTVSGADRLHRRFPRGKLVWLTDAGHLPFLENPGETAAIYLDFLRTHAAPRRPGR